MGLPEVTTPETRTKASVLRGNKCPSGGLSYLLSGQVNSTTYQGKQLRRKRKIPDSKILPDMLKGTCRMQLRVQWVFF